MSLPRTILAASAALWVLGSVPPARAGLVVLGTDEVTKAAIDERGGSLFLTWGEREWELLTSTDSPHIANPGDGSFHAFDARLVQQVIDELPRRARNLDGAVLVLPFPRRGELKSTHENGAVFLSPGVRPWHDAHVHATVAHEIGHVVQHRLAPEGSAAWSRYLELRGLGHERFHRDAAHRDRPREIFAEDFRLLLGGARARAAGAHENPDLPIDEVSPALVEWFSELMHLPVIAEAHVAVVAPNPARASANSDVVVRFAGNAVSAEHSHADVFDVRGRRVATLATRVSGSAVEVRWEPRDAAGRTLPTGVYFVRLRDVDVPAAAVHWIR